MADHIVRAVVEGDRPVYINSVLHFPGEAVAANLDQLKVDKLGDKTPGLAKASGGAEDVDQVKIAAVAPHAPDAPNPQGIASGTVQSGTGRLITPAPSGDESPVQPVGADAAVTQDERKEAAAATKPSKPAAK